MIKLSDNPPMRYDLADDFTTEGDTWWVAHTKSRFEKALAWDLIRQGTSYFLPMVERTRISSGRKRRVMMPLFPSYVFFCGDEETRYQAMSTNRVCYTLDVHDQDRFVSELSSIGRALDCDAELDVYPHAVVGKCCRVTAGPLENVEGVVVRRGSNARVALEISTLGQAVIMEISADMLEEVG